jgi:5-methylthioadenosine/S-adenosylhomocysteine deaminase
MATLGGARALGMEDRIGSLETGKRADIVVVDVSGARMTPMYNPVSHLVYAAKGADVRHVVVEGRIVMRDRAVLTLDERAVVARAAALAARVTASLRP